MDKYELVFVMPDGKIITRLREGAKHAHASLVGYPVKKAVFGLRYYPSRKAWRVLDLRHKVVTVSYGTFRDPRAAAPVVFEHPDKDAAIMWATLRLNG